MKALALVLRDTDGAVLVSEGENSSGGRYARPLGGSVEFGESAAAAVQREMVEEVGCRLLDPLLLTVVENRFLLDERPGHEIVFVFSGRLADESLYLQDRIPVLDVPGLTASWWHPEVCSSRLVPDQLRAWVPGAG